MFPQSSEQYFTDTVLYQTLSSFHTRFYMFTKSKAKENLFTALCYGIFCCLFCRLDLISTCSEHDHSPQVCVSPSHRM